MNAHRGRIESALAIARERLIEERTAEGYWTGELSSSALSTATAIIAIEVWRQSQVGKSPEYGEAIYSGLTWLARHQNSDGGWGDTIRSLSNISTTALAWAALNADIARDHFAETAQRAGDWLVRKAGGTDSGDIAGAIIQRYGKDRTFSVPILTACALMGRLGPEDEAWRRVLPLPFELAALPHQFYAAVRLPVVSYALPALIAIGQAHHAKRPSRNPVLRAIRNAVRARTLEILKAIQPAGGGFLEATPLTSFVVMSLVAAGHGKHPVSSKGIAFLLKSARTDGSWPIDTNLSTWVTTLAVNALASAGESLDAVMSADCKKTSAWLLEQQYQTKHPYTHAAPGAWAWTPLSGGVPDADDTPGALLALKALGTGGDAGRSAVAGIRWLLNLQNRDGGIPTFCRGWGALPFDRSAPDLTAHSLRAWNAWFPELSRSDQRRIAHATTRALEYLAKAQRADGSWLPLWFGNQFQRDDENPTYGTSRVVLALAELNDHRARDSFHRGTEWLRQAQQTDGSWGGSAQGPPSIEETALAVEALAAAASIEGRSSGENGEAATRGALWLANRISEGTWTEPAPVGFYFAKLWYYERLYPVIFTVAALSRTLKWLRGLDR